MDEVNRILFEMLELINEANNRFINFNKQEFKFMVDENIYWKLRTSSNNMIYYKPDGIYLCDVEVIIDTVHVEDPAFYTIYLTMINSNFGPKYLGKIKIDRCDLSCDQIKEK